jgi:hypothetical protein
VDRPKETRLDPFLHKLFGECCREPDVTVDQLLSSVVIGDVGREAQSGRSQFYQSGMKERAQPVERVVIVAYRLVCGVCDAAQDPIDGEQDEFVATLRDLIERPPGAAETIGEIADGQVGEAFPKDDVFEVG